MAVHEAHSEGMAKVQALWNEADKRSMEKARLAEEAARAEEQRRTTAARKETENAQHDAELARSDADRARLDVRRLRDAANVTAASCRPISGNSSAASVSAPTSSAAELLADMLGELGSAGAALAEEADRRRIAGVTCERIYDSLAKR
jgi:hypothetical protein